jgi:molecular chaperone DnaJ
VQTELTLDEVSTGVEREVSFQAVVVCEHCHGNGAEPGTPIETCDRCGGAGQLRQVTRTPFGQMVRGVVCDVCHGSGKVPDTPCEVCDGVGRTQGRVTKTIDVPAGIEDGQRLRVSGAGHAGESGAPAGDLYVEVSVAADGRFERQGTDLVSAVRIPATEAMLGTTVTVSTLEGEREIELDPGVQPGHEETLKGAGLPRLGGRRRGDQRVVVEVVVPTNLSDEQREIAERLDGTLEPDNLGPQHGDGFFGRMRNVFR